MRIKRLKLTGFKSFVEPAELRIEPGLTGVVGPNGCGKSNLLEAIRWVMGESSPKSMRGGGMDDVIFAGTETRPARSFAEVTILADRPPSETPGPLAAANDGDIEVVRRIERGAGSAYRVNGRDVRAKDVALIFADAATGAHSPALVSQGRIGAVIAARPADRRAMLEEAAGIAGLHVRRKDAEQKLRATEVNLERLDVALTDMTARADTLRRQARQAERYRRVSGEIRVAEARLVYARWRDAAAAADAAKAEANAAEGAVATAAESQRAAAAWQAEAVATLAARRGAAELSRETAAEAGRTLATLHSEQAALVRRLAELATQAERLAEDRAREGALANDAAGALARLGDEGKSIELRMAEAAREKPILAGRLAQVEAEARDAEVALAQALGAQASEQAEIRIAEAAAQSARARLGRVAGERDRLRAELAGLDDDGDWIALRATAASKRAEAEAVVRSAMRAIEQADAARAQASAARDAAESAAAEARSTLAALDSEATALQRSIGQPSGDRLIHQVRANPGYERALAAALADDLDTNSADWAGAEPRPDDPALPPNAEPLAKHVEAPPALARCLAQIGVVERDDGASLAVGQRLVTRDGTLRRWDGFCATERGAAAAARLVRINRLTEIERQFPEARGAAEGAKADADGARAAVEQAKTDFDQARAALARAEPAVRAALREEDQLAARIERAHNRRAELGERLRSADGEHAEGSGESARAESALKALPDTGETVRNVATLQGVAETVRTRAAGSRADIAALERALAADRERAAAVLAEAKGWRARAGEAAKRIEQMARREAEAAAEAQKLADAPAQIAEQITARDAAVATLAAAAETARITERDAEDALRALEVKAADAGETLAAAREARAGALARAENQELRRVEMGRISGERFESPPPLLPERVGFASGDVADADAESARHDRLVAERERIGPVNLVAESELAEIEAEHTTSARERDELGQAINRLRGSIGSLNREGRRRLLAAFEAVDGHFRRLFKTLFNGGEAHLALVDSDDPLEAGLEIFAQPPGKKLAALTLLSGGEQALTAIALIFGLFLTNPAPICVLDEVDAPLDDANIERFCDLLDAMTRETDTRYLIVTHSAVTMSRMHRLFGVTMIEQGVSRLVSVDLGGAGQLLAAE